MPEQSPESRPGTDERPVDQVGDGRTGPAPETAAPGRRISIDKDMEELRRLLLGAEGKHIHGLQERLELISRFEAEGQVDAMGRELPSAIAYHNNDNTQLANALAPTIEKTLNLSIRRNPQPFVDAIFPAIGPAIRRSINEALRSVMESMNRIMEHSLSIRSLKWRIEAARTGRPFSEVVLSHNLNYRVEQLFLIDKKSGLLIQHLFAESIAVKDSDVVSSMLNAIQDFVRDSLGAPREDVLESIEIGDLTVMVEPGPDAILAAVVRGIPMPELRTTLKEIIEAIHLQYGHLLDDFEGDPEPLTPVLPLMRAGLLEKYKEKEKNTTRLWLLAGVIALGLTIWFAWSFRNYMLWTQYIDALKDEPGLMVTQTHWEVGRFVVEGLKDPMAVDPVSLLPAQLSPEKVEGVWGAYLAMDSLIIVKRAARQLRAPEGVVFRLENDVLYTSGSAPGDWISSAREKAPFLLGFSVYDDRDLRAGGGIPELTDIEAIRTEIEAVRIAFTQGSSVLSPDQITQLDRLTAIVQSLENMNTSEGRLFQLQITGYASTEGGEEANLILSEARAERVKDALISRGISEQMVTTSGTGNPINSGVEATEEERALNRRVLFEVVEQ